MSRSTRSRALSFTFTVAVAAALAAAPGCGGSDEVKLADAPPDATEKVLKSQTRPTAKAQTLPPAGQQSQGRPY